MTLRLVFAICVLPATAAATDVSDLDWLAGCWRLAQPEPQYLEYWMPPSGGLVLGMTRLVEDGRAVSWEQLRIANGEDDTLEYQAQTNTGERVVYRLSAIGPSMVVFENPANPFPQRIVYQRRGEDGLLTRLEGRDAGEPRVVEVPLVRCKPADGAMP